MNYMKDALYYAQKANVKNEVPVGAILVRNQNIIGKSYNKGRVHAEFLLLKTCTIFDDCDLYVTLEPCCLCASLIAHTRIRRLYFGAYDPKTGGVEHNAQVFNYTHHKPEVIGGILEQECAKLLSSFFKHIRFR
jgi:tRNA(adenine34) deaminase